MTASNEKPTSSSNHEEDDVEALEQDITEVTIEESESQSDLDSSRDIPSDETLQTPTRQQDVDGSNTVCITNLMSSNRNDDAVLSTSAMIVDKDDLVEGVANGMMMHPPTQLLNSEGGRIFHDLVGYIQPMPGLYRHATPLESRPGAHPVAGGVWRTPPRLEPFQFRSAAQQVTVGIQEEELANHLGLVVASPVEEDDVTERNLQTASEVIEEPNVTRRTGVRQWDRRRSAVGGVVLLVVIFVVVTVTLLLGGNQEDTADTGVRDKTVVPPDPTLLVEAIQRLLPNYTMKAMEDANSPQTLAFDWLVNDPSLLSYPDWRILQRYALATFYFATEGQYWKRNDGWLNDTSHECQWYARHSVGMWVEYVIEIDHELPCEDDPNGHYRHLWLWSNDLVGTLPQELSWLTELRSISLYHNSNVGGSFPSSLGLLTSLEVFNMAGLSLNSTIPTEVGMMESMKALVLTDNKFTGTIPTQLSLPPNLMLVVLEDNELSGTIPTQLGLCRGLLGLWIPRNQLLGTIPSELGMLSNLVYLDLTGQDLAGTIPEQLGNLPLIKRIILPNNHLTGTVPVMLGTLSTMTNLMLQNNNFEGTVPTEIAQMTLLERLLMSDNFLTGRIPSQLGLLTQQLTDLRFASNLLTGAIPSELGMLTQLTDLNVSFNLLTGSFPQELKNLASGALTDLNAAGNSGLTGAVPAGLCNLKLIGFDCSDTLCGCQCTC